MMMHWKLNRVGNVELLRAMGALGFQVEEYDRVH